MSGNQSPLISMKRTDGTISEVHLPGLVVKPDKNGAVLVPSEFVVQLLNAGFIWADWSNI
jgi:hypothetical protein